MQNVYSRLNLTNGAVAILFVGDVCSDDFDENMYASFDGESERIDHLGAPDDVRAEIVSHFDGLVTVTIEKYLNYSSVYEHLDLFIVNNDLIIQEMLDEWGFKEVSIPELKKAADEFDPEEY